jgi:hypothetical protein
MTPSISSIFSFHSLLGFSGFYSEAGDVIKITVENLVMATFVSCQHLEEISLGIVSDSFCQFRIKVLVFSLVPHGCNKDAGIPKQLHDLLFELYRIQEGKLSFIVKK